MSEFYDVYENRVRLEETDATGIVFFGNYTVYLDEAMIAYFDEMGFDRETIFDREWSMAIVNVEIDYRSYTDFGDEIANKFRISDIGEKSFTGAYRAHLTDSDKLLAEGSITAAIIDGQTKEPIAIPDELRDAIEDFQDEI